MAVAEFNQLLLSNAEALRPYASTLTKDNESSKDLLQETLFRALANREKYRVGTNIKAWLFTIMRNIFINNYRKAANQKTFLQSGDNDFFLDFKQLSIANSAEINLKVKEIESAIYRLPDIFKKPFVLYFEGFKYFEISQMLKEPLGTIKSRIHFARKLLKEQVERY